MRCVDCIEDAEVLLDGNSYCMKHALEKSEYNKKIKKIEDNTLKNLLHRF